VKIGHGGDEISGKSIFESDQSRLWRAVREIITHAQIPVTKHKSVRQLAEDYHKMLPSSMYPNDNQFRQRMEQKNPNFYIVLDTNAVYGGPNNLVNRKSSSAILEISKKQDIATYWYLPRMVKDEREYQVLTQAQALLGPISRAEKLLGRDFDVSPDVFKTAVSAVVKKGMTDHKLQEAPLDVTKVNWNIGHLEQ
jgi:hypothetical protein